MPKTTIYITQTDADKIRDLLREAGNSGYRGSPYIRQLEGELNRAEIVPPGELHPNVIAMNATAELLDVETGERLQYTLVFPDQADLSQGKISVLAPIGAAMLGYQVGDEFEWDTPGGRRTLRVEQIIDRPAPPADRA